MVILFIFMAVIHQERLREIDQRRQERLTIERREVSLGTRRMSTPIFPMIFNNRNLRGQNPEPLFILLAPEERSQASANAEFRPHVIIEDVD